MSKIRGIVLTYIRVNAHPLILLAFGLIILAFLVLSGCKTACQHLDTRCSGQEVQVCASNQDWQEVMTCDQLKQNPVFEKIDWVCCVKESGATCVPKEECK